MLSTTSTIRNALLILLISATTIQAADCPERVTAESWTNSWGGGEKTQKAFFAQLASCLPGDTKKQETIDDFAVNTLYGLESIPAEDQKSLLDFTMQVLLINAKAGFPSSQHNYAALHNAEPGSLLQKLAPQDYATFLYWTRSAAAQREPRAVFNLAVRMANDKPPAGITRDIPTAYTLLRFLEQSYATVKDMPPGMIEYASQLRSKLSKRLGAKRCGQLDSGLKQFDFSKLAPREKE